MEGLGSVDPSYEYNAPQFIDFDDIDKLVNEENVEDYFNFDHEAGVPVSIGESFNDNSSIYEDASGSRQNTPRSLRKKTPAKKTPGQNGRRNTPRSCRSTPANMASPVVVPGTGKENELPGVVSTTMGALKTAAGLDMPQIKPALSNLCTDPSKWRKGLTAPSQNTMKARRKSLRKSAGKARTSFEQPKQCHQSPANKKHKRSNSLQQTKQGPFKVPQAQPDVPNRSRTRTKSVDNKGLLQKQKVTPKRGRTMSVEHVLNEKPAPRNASSGASTRSHRRTASASNVPVKTRSVSVNSNGSAKRSGSASRSSSATRKNTSMNTSHEGVKLMKPMLTMPCTPSFMKRKPLTSAPNQKTTEEMELEKIRELRKDLARKRKMAEDSYKTAQSSSGYVPKHSTAKVTKPVDLKFATDDRIKEHSMETRQDRHPKDFTSMLRHNSPVDNSKPLCSTKPVPFHFAEKKRKREEEEAKGSYPFRSVAEKMIAFARKTPDRFRTRGKNDKVSLLAGGPAPKLTVPKTPNLESRKRHRPTTVKSAAEMEEEQAAEIKRYKFHAQPLDEEMLRGPRGVKKVEPKELTKPMEFDLETDRRLQYRHEHAKSIEEVEPELHHFHSKPVAHHGIPFLPKYEHKVTEPKPFSFERRDRERFAKKEEKIHQIVEEERRKASEFKARPLKDLSPQLPTKKPVPITHPQPFDLAVDHRGQQKAEDWSHKVEEELRQQRAAANFRARPNVVTKKNPFIPQKSTKPLTDVDDLELATDRRAEEREEYEKHRHEREMEIEMQKKQAERMKEEEERRRVEEMRHAAVHKAQPVRKYKRVEVKPSDRPLTEPKTPRFSARLKTRV